ncbi:MAG: hypothetical protein Q7V31_03660 [Parvibaculum sp.]|uniref:hypothetical protein n=1 Tax=Parvibaculum sp. TaxID=2024848 RepID=UPI0027223617|nr:hypothetical protein [Parvibaculum sp.]MDO8837999.1 hypothetical protein [Parvibaculum sp.]
MTDAPALPGILATIAAVAGDGAARLVAKEWGGRRFYLPKEFRPTHRLVELMGETKARKVFEALGGGAPVLVPMGDVAGPAARRRIVGELLDKGESQAKAAQAAGVHTRTVERVSRRKRNARQGELF